MRPPAVGLALLLVAAVPAVAPSSAGATSPTGHGTVAVGVVVPGLATATGPRPLTTEGGHAVAVAPRWWPQGKGSPSAPWNPRWPKPVEFSPVRAGPLSGLVIALDPGHDLGNSSHLRAINQTSWVGLRKICNTTGTATNAGYPESTYAFDVVARLRRLLVAQGATVVVTRDRNTSATYGPCVGARGAFPAQEKAALMVAVHADGAPAGGRGFHVIAPAYYKGYTDDHYKASGVLAAAMVAGMVSRGFPRSTYLSSTISVRKDQGGLNTSDVPTVTVETLNMRNAADARIAMSAVGRQRVAQGLYAGILRYTRTRVTRLGG